MTAYQSLLFPDAGPIEPTKKKKRSRMNLRGCEYCPQNNVEGIVKIKGTVEGKRIFVWAQSPGPIENEVGKELWGPSGKWFWARMAEAGIKRSDCDIQNVMRCFPADERHGRLVMRNPSKEELLCCSLYTERAIEKSEARVHIVLGQVAAKQLFGAKFKGDKIFWSEKLNGRVVILDHPAYFIRGYASAEKLKTFKAGLEAAAKFAKEKSRFAFLEEQDYVAATTEADARKSANEIRAWAQKGFRITADLEAGRLFPGGPVRPLCYGFSGEAGSARVFLLEHRTGIDVPKDVRNAIRRVVVSLLEDKDIKKACHHGSYDSQETQELIGCNLEGYNYDTNYAEYFRFPGRHSYALGEIIAVRYPEFAGFKEVIMPEAAPKGMTYDAANSAGALNFANVPWKKLVLRCAADCDLTKRIEISTKKHVSLPLLHVYMDAAFTLDRMETHGPWFDYKQCELLGEIYPTRLKRQREELQLIAGDPEFNPGSPPQVADVIYDKLKLPMVGEKRTTKAAVLEALSEHHKFPEKIIQFRRDSKLESTYRTAFKNCADANKGRLFTKWWLTGTKTGRLSSGGSREGEERLTVNLQNIVGDEQVENMLISDVNWRDIYEAWKECGGKGDWFKHFLDYYVYLKFDYAQNELRFLAQSSGDENLIADFLTGRDIHCVVGHEFTGWSEEVIAANREKRTLIKGFHFGLVYGLTVDGMHGHLTREGLKISKKSVEEKMERYFRRYGGVKRFINAKRREAQDKHYVENILGFRCPINPDGSDEGGYWANLAVNAPIQGGAHQVLLICLALLQRKPKEYAVIRTPEAENHDAISIRVKLSRLFEAMQVVKKLAEHDVIEVLKKDFKLDWRVPFKADVKAGFRYGVMVDIEEGMPIGKFLDKWCRANQTCQRALWRELRQIRESEASMLDSHAKMRQIKPY